MKKGVKESEGEREAISGELNDGIYTNKSRCAWVCVCGTSHLTAKSSK